MNKNTNNTCNNSTLKIICISKKGKLLMNGLYDVSDVYVISDDISTTYALLPVYHTDDK